MQWGRTGEPTDLAARLSQPLKAPPKALRSVSVPDGPAAPSNVLDKSADNY
jgi:hypothetical protein